MPSHLSSIGIGVKTEDEFNEFVFQAADTGTKIETNNGSYIRWSSGAGSEAWIQVSQENELIGMNPHFSGNAVMQVGIIKRIEDEAYSPMDGAFYGWAGSSDDNPEDGYYPFVFDVPDYLLYSNLSLPIVVNVQLAGFAHELQAFESEEHYKASQTEEPKFASESFIPAGLFTPDGESTQPPQAYAIFSGYVLQTARLTNPATGGTFYWAHVRTLGGEVDVVADPEVISGELTKDGIIQGTFWLSGRIIKDL